MFVVTTKNGPDSPKVITRSVSRVKALVSRAIKYGGDARVKQYFADVLVCNSDGVFVLVQKRVAYKDAEEFQRRWNLSERDSSCLLWPSEMPLPSSWTFIEDDDEPRGDLSTTRKPIGKRKRTQAA